MQPANREERTMQKRLGEEPRILQGSLSDGKRKLAHRRD